ncbi:MAG: YfjI family protein [Ruminococcus sp.]|nr:YfjI family protein [Ruminococcus sp.]
MEEKECSAFDIYRDVLRKGCWIQYFEGASYTDERWNRELPAMCNAALLEANVIKATDFFDCVFQHCKEYPPTPATAATLNFTQNRLDKLRENGGWLPITETEQAEDPLSVSFPTEAFPAGIEKYLKSVVAYSQVDTAMTFSAALATFALCMQGKYMVSYPSGNGWKEHLCLYLVIVAEPGETKSGTFGAVNRPIRAWQDEKRADYEKSRNLYLQEKQAKEEKQKNLKKAIANLKTPPEKQQQYHEELKEITDELTELQAPISPNFIVADTTMEALADLMMETGGSAGVFGSEGDFFKIITGLYNHGVCSNLQLILNAYDGDSYMMRRVTRDTYLQRPLLSFCLMLQPNLYQETFANAELRGRGLLARFLTCTPKSMAGKRDKRSTATLDAVNYVAYEKAMAHFLNLQQDSEKEPPVLTWEQDAKERMLDYMQTIENSMGKGQPMEDCKDYANKASAVAMRIAGILHLLQTYSLEQIPPITKETTEKAIKVHRFFFAEKLKELQEIETREAKLEEKLLERIKKETILKEKACVSVREIHQSLRSTRELKRKEDFELYLQALAEKNYIQVEEVEKKKSLIYISPYANQ